MDLSRLGVILDHQEALAIRGNVIVLHLGQALVRHVGCLKEHLRWFSFELWGPEQVPNFYGGMDSTYITNEISVTRLLSVLPIFLGMRFAGGTLGGWKTMIIANFVCVFWAMGLVDLLHFVDATLELGTHYGRGFSLPHFMGHIYDLKGWIPRLPSTGFSFCASILMMTLVTNLVCFVTIKLNPKEV